MHRMSFNQGAMSHKPVSSYRRDIDGLRAISVLMVVAFHAFPKWFSGGFIGVDVFFVISGFLITGIILDDVDAQRFSILRFYQRRIRRIFPALLVLLVSVLVAGWFLLSPDEYKQLGWHVFSSGLFFQNITLFFEAGYFDVVADYKPLLHLWSLSVEEQFYLVYPLLLAVLARAGRLTLGVTALAALSLGACLFQTHSQGHSVQSFYLPQYRFWELLMGSLVQIRTRSSGALPFRWLSLLGIVLLAAGLAFTSRTTPFPGLMTLLPVFGAVCILGAQPSNWFASRILGARLLVAIGLISYPLYLVHWPLFSFARLLTAQEPTWLIKSALILSSCVLAVLTYFVVERPLRFGGSKAGTSWLDWRTIVLVSGMLLSILAGYYVCITGGVPSRPVASLLDRYIQDRIGVSVEIKKRYRLVSCAREPLISRGAHPDCSMYGPNSASETIVVWGDSHADAWASVFFEIAQKRGARIVLFHHLGFPPLLDVVRTDIEAKAHNCMDPERAKAIVESIQQLKPSHVFLIARWSLYANGWYKGGKLLPATHFLSTNPDTPADLATSRQALATKLPETVYALAQASPVTIVKTLPVLKSDIDAIFLGRAIATSVEEHLTAEQFSNHLIEGLVKNSDPSLRPITVMDPASLMCAEDTCAAIIGRTVMYNDDNHITSQGAMLYEDTLASYLKPAGSSAE